MKILRKAKLNCYKNLNLNNIIDNRKFCNTIKPVFTDKVKFSQSITLVETGEMVTDDLKIAEIFIDYFTNITQDLEITEQDAHLSPTIGKKTLWIKLLENIKTILASKK